MAIPSYSADQAFAEAFVKQNHSRGSDKWRTRLVHTCFIFPGIRKRHFQINDLLDLVDGNLDRRIDRFTAKSIELSPEALNSGLEQG